MCQPIVENIHVCQLTLVQSTSKTNLTALAILHFSTSHHLTAVVISLLIFVYLFVLVTNIIFSSTSGFHCVDTSWNRDTSPPSPNPSPLSLIFRAQTTASILCYSKSVRIRFRNFEQNKNLLSLVWTGNFGSSQDQLVYRKTPQSKIRLLPGYEQTHCHFFRFQTVGYGHFFDF